MSEQRVQRSSTQEIPPTALRSRLVVVNASSDLRVITAQVMKALFTLTPKTAHRAPTLSTCSTGAGPLRPQLIRRDSKPVRTP